MSRLFAFSLAALIAVTLGLVSCKQPEPPAAPPAQSSSTPADKPIQIPKVSVLPEAPGDWTKQAHQVLSLHPVEDMPGAKEKLAVAWTPTALLLQVTSDDVTPIEADGELWAGDSVEIFLASSYGSDDRVQFVCTPGRTPEHPEPRWRPYDKRTDAPPIGAPEMHTQKDAKGYVMTFSVPWANLKHIPQPGDVIGLQVYVHDAQGTGVSSQRTWFPGHQANQDALQMQRAQLAAQADPPELAIARIHLKGFNDFAVEVLAVPEAAGKNIEIWSGEKQVASGKLAAAIFDGDSTADIPLPPELAGQKDAPLIVTVDGQPLPPMLKVPDLAAARLNLVKNQPIVASPSIFDGAAFPKIDFLDKELFEAAIGPYALHIRYFDANWNEVTTPTSPGRYGALVEFRSENGVTFTRNVTLFKTPKTYFPAKAPYAVTAKFPAAFGLPDSLAAKEEWNVNNWIGGALEGFARRDSNGASLVAALHDLASDPARYHGFTTWKIDMDWWAELRKRLGENQDYPHLTYLPDGYDKDQRAWPLILFLHGSGERGADLNKIKNKGPLDYINKGHPLPFIVITPQCPSDEWWDSARLVRLIDQVAAANRVDPKRIYVTGLSMGGFGSFDLAASYPDKFAAIAPLSGGENPAIAERLKKMPTWIFHGDEDGVVPARYSVDIFHAMQKLGAPVKLTVYPGVGHSGWDTTYDDPEFYAWLLQHSK
jgi:predicted esterase